MTENESDISEDLIDRLRQGDPRAFSALYRRYARSIERYCFHLTGDPDLAADVTHDAFELALRDILTLRSSAAFKPWLFGIARNRCLTTMRRRRKEIRLEESHEVITDATPFSLLASAELSDLIRKAIHTLKPIYREAIVLREFELMSYKEIAETTESTITSVKFRIHKARQALVEILGPALDEKEMP